MGSSFRDPSGFVFRANGEYLRAVHPSYAENYRHLLSSGLYQLLTSTQRLIPHTESEADHALPEKPYKVLHPQQLAFLSQPYEWAFSQLKDCALTTLSIQQSSLEHGMSLKDASAFNLQFVDGTPLLIDTLSFEQLDRRKPWTAYRQFCSHFLAPLALMAATDCRLHQLSRLFLDGIPLDLASRLLPARTWLKPSLLLHIHLHALSQRWYRDRPLPPEPTRPTPNPHAIRNLTASLETATRGLRREPARNLWGNYYDATVLGGAYVEEKKNLVTQFLQLAQPRKLWDLGGNTGVFSRLAADSTGADVVSFDLDPDCVDANYRECRRSNQRRVLPLVQDLTNPSPACGWHLAERDSFLQRPAPDLVMALALVHHLAIAHNLPLPWIANFLARLAPSLIIEFVPKDDPNAQKLLRARPDIFPHYTRDGFEAAFGQFYRTDRAVAIPASNRHLYLLRRREPNP